MTLKIGEPLSDIGGPRCCNNLGRLALPDEFLTRPNRPGAVSAHSCTHTVHGHTRLKKVPFRAAARSAVAAPSAGRNRLSSCLRGDAIPLGARLSAMPDAYERSSCGPARRSYPGQAIDILDLTAASSIRWERRVEDASPAGGPDRQLAARGEGWVAASRARPPRARRDDEIPGCI